jgi:hypothetical protein
MSYGNFVRAFKEFGAMGTFKKLYQQRTLKFGQLIGTDRYGNKYFENTTEYNHGEITSWFNLPGLCCCSAGLLS